MTWINRCWEITTELLLPQWGPFFIMVTSEAGLPTLLHFCVVHHKLFLLFWSGSRSHVPHANPFPVTSMDSRPHDSMNNSKSLRWYSHSIYKCWRCNIKNKFMPWSTIVSNQDHLSQKKSACFRNTFLRGWKSRCFRITMSSQGEITTHI